jgi:hypothetical protein
MAYYTGTDVKVWVCTEMSTAGIKLGSDAVSGAKLTATITDTDFLAGAAVIAPMGLANKGIGMNDFNIADITGVDLSVGAQDEDISYFGTKTPGKIETKADLSVTLTMKKKNRLWSTLGQGLTVDASSYASVGNHSGRWGMIKAAASADFVIADGTVDPKSSTDGTNICYGYRVAIQLKDASGTDGANRDGTVIVLRNCSFGEYTVTLSNDAADEETVSFVTMVKPLILNGKHDPGSNLFQGGKEATLAAEM